jgi:predicted RNase H-like HicB family nuclease
MSNHYLVIVESAEDNFAAFSPDLPGCVATGATREETLRSMRAAIQMHLQGLREDGLPLPEPSSTAEYLSA